MWGRIQAQYTHLKEGVQRLETRDLLLQLDDKIARTLHYLDDFALSQSSAKDLAIVMGILIEKRQLLKGEPTQIISTEDRSKLINIMPLLIVEAKRRGLTIDMNPETQEAVVVDDKKLKVHTKGLVSAKEVVGTGMRMGKKGTQGLPVDE
jgi:hypothetical protein